MAQFYNGLEETAWTGWTLTNVVASGPRLLLTCPVNGLSSTTGWTLNSGVAPTVESGRFKWGGSAASYTAPSAMNVSGDFDLRVDLDVVTRGGAVRYNRLGVTLGANSVSVSISATGFELLITSSVNVGTLAVEPMAATLRLARAGNVFTAYYKSLSDPPGTWTTIGTTTQGTYQSTGTVFINEAAGTYKVYNDNLRQVIPSQTSGTAESPVMDTADGFCGVGWFSDYGGTGTILVEYRAGATSGACSAATYQAATNWLAITPGAGNRYVQVRLTISSGSTSAASPEVGPILVNGSISQANLQLLLNRAVTSACRHTDSNNRLAALEPASGTAPYTVYWSRFGLGVAALCNGLSSTSLTFEGTTFAFAQQFIDGFDRTQTDMAADEQLNVEAAVFALPGIWAAKASLVPLISGARKTTWKGNIGTQSAAAPSNNHLAFSTSNYAHLDALNTYDGGNWTAYADAALDTPYNALHAFYKGAGAFDDNANHYDSYQFNATEVLGHVATVRPAYNAASILAWLTGTRRNATQITDPDGETIYTGRSVTCTQRGDGGRMAASAARAYATGYDAVRELHGRLVWQTLRRSYLHGFDLFLAPAYREGNLASIEGYGSRGLVLGNWASFLGYLAYDANFPAGAGTFTQQSANVWAWPEAGIATVLGSSSADGVQIQLHAKSSDTTLGATSYYASKYMTRAAASRFGQNVGDDANRQTSPAGMGVVFTSSALSSGNKCFLGDAGTAAVYHLGRSAAAWRSNASSRQGSATVSLTATGPAVTEIFYACRNHYVVLSKVAAGAATLSNAHVVSPPIPLPAASALTNPATNTSGSTWAYGESASADLSVFVRGVSSNLDTPTATTDYLADASQINRFNNAGQSVGVSCSTTPTGNVYFAADVALSHGTMTASTEATWLTNYSQVGDVVTFTADSNGTPENVYLALVAQNLSGQTIGSYAVTGGSVTCFSGKSSAADWCGGQGVTLIKFGGANAVALASAGNVAYHRATTLLTRVFWDGGSNLTLYPPSWPAGLATVYAIDWNGSRVDITSSCTLTAGTSLVVPTSAVSAYDFGLVTLELVGNGSGVFASYNLRRRRAS